MAVEAVIGAEPAWFCEWEDAPSKVLAHHWPTVPNFRDVTQVDWEQVPRVDILTGGYPCQPFSQAGRRKGEHDERHLWPYVRAAIRVLRPRFAFLENVAGHRSLGFDTVLGDLAEDGADVWWTSVRASDVGAPHHRERLFMLIVPADTDSLGLEAGRSPRRPEAEVAGHNNSERALPDTIRTGRNERRGPAPGEAEGRRPHSEPDRCGDDIHWGDYAPAVRRWERVTRPAPAPTEPNRNNKPRLNPEFASWMMGLPAGHVTSIPGLTRADQLKAIGNGVCPQQGAMALHELLTMMEETI